MIRRELRFFGRVQHVGFRYKAMSLASNNNLTGWVKNEYDGSVTMCVQGEEKDIDHVILALVNDRYIRIDRYTVVKREPEEHEKSFVIRHYT